MSIFRRRNPDLQDAIEAYLRTVALDAPIRGVLARAEVREQYDVFVAADRTALRKQKRYRQAGWLARLAALLGVLIVPIEVLPVDHWLPESAPVFVNALRGVTLAFIFVAVILLGLRRSAVRWKQARGEAEKARAEFFRRLIRAGADKGVLDQALACFKVAHLDWQAGFYDSAIKRFAPRIERERSQRSPFRVIGIVLSVIAAVLGFVTLLRFLAAEGHLPTYLLTYLSWLPEPAHWQHGLHATAASLLAFAGARFLTHADMSAAALYPWARDEIKRIERDELMRAQSAAAVGDIDTVEQFCARVQEVLDREHSVWGSDFATQGAASSTTM
jgi:hypothetical protein